MHFSGFITQSLPKKCTEYSTVKNTFRQITIRYKHLRNLVQCRTLYIRSPSLHIGTSFSHCLCTTKKPTLVKKSMSGSLLLGLISRLQALQAPRSCFRARHPTSPVRYEVRGEPRLCSLQKLVMTYSEGKGYVRYCAYCITL